MPKEDAQYFKCVECGLVAEFDEYLNSKPILIDGRDEYEEWFRCPDCGCEEAEQTNELRDAIMKVVDE